MSDIIIKYVGNHIFLLAYRMKDGDDGWRYVIASKNRHVRGDISTWGNYSNNKKFDKNLLPETTPANVDIDKVVGNIDSIVSTIKSSTFYSFLSEALHKVVSKNLKMIVLGCASPTCGPFITNCKCQWALAKLLTVDSNHLFKIISVEIFDPLMSDTDYQIWQRLIEFPNTTAETDWTLLIMPHCEVDLYRTVLESLSHKLDIIESAKQLASGSYVFRNIAKLSNVILLSNTLSNCDSLDLNTEITEIKLPKFDPYPNAFNDLYLITIDT
ncbi:hypothetical protein BMR1_03g04660 [Babesia microti strain RI]|uniref:SRR1-like domain-containing protein n=1 Tax=Babesia microti (strain RI) TaxID=1133968 RepID=A0A0K3ASU3_BABMR|nr:hypothetical protein BMR1_03g04660 [Babesia microti strain RI]CTQ41530.1 hypothetical protein BMR1_03g04660 [Babesia microti strain RI]|eukprot:XP_012649541.1 hypothetical protein BMR1_03g04660 [Babesia microti strain RI]